MAKRSRPPRTGTALVESETVGTLRAPVATKGKGQELKTATMKPGPIKSEKKGFPDLREGGKKKILKMQHGGNSWANLWERGGRPNPQCALRIGSLSWGGNQERRKRVEKKKKHGSSARAEKPNRSPIKRKGRGEPQTLEQTETRGKTKSFKAFAQ